MRLTIATNVQSQPEKVWAKFDADLFVRLAPPFPRVRLVHFGGCQTGDRVEIELNFLLFRLRWLSVITEHSIGDDEILFVDEGQVLPFFLRQWRHCHRLIRTDEGTRIVDQIEYHSRFLWLDYLLFPMMWGQFAYRRPIYRRVFNTSHAE